MKLMTTKLTRMEPTRNDTGAVPCTGDAIPPPLASGPPPFNKGRREGMEFAVTTVISQCELWTDNKPETDDSFSSHMKLAAEDVEKYE